MLKKKLREREGAIERARVRASEERMRGQRGQGRRIGQGSKRGSRLERDKDGRMSGGRASERAMKRGKDWGGVGASRRAREQEAKGARGGGRRGARERWSGDARSFPVNSGPLRVRLRGESSGLFKLGDHWAPMDGKKRGLLDRGCSHYSP